MKNKQLDFSDLGREKLLDGVQKLVRTVESTLGPNGRNVIIERENENPVSTKDGVTAAKAIQLKNSVENLGVQIVRQAAIKTGEEAGDGTTTSTTLAGALIKNGLDALEEPGTNSVEVKRGIDLAVKDIVNFLSSRAKDITDEQQLKQIATISGNNDPEVGELIASAMEDVGQDGVITIEESRTGQTYLETVEGMQLKKGYKSPFFVTDNASMSVTLENPVILITDQKLHKAKDLLPLLESCSSQSKPLLIVADDISGEALSTLIVNKGRGILQTVAVQAPDFGDRKKDILEDLATVTGGQVVSVDKGMKLSAFNTDWLGKARKVTVDKNTTVVVDGNGASEDITKRAEDIKSLIEKAISPYEIEVLQDRLGRMAGGIGVIHVGGYTEVEMKEKKDRVEDALHATRAALEEGILPGGGIALLYASISLFDTMDTIEFTHSDQRTGYLLALSSIKKPIYSILFNALGESAAVLDIMDRLVSDYLPDEEESFWRGYNPRIKDFTDMFSSGVIDPKKVTRLALENASSVAGTFLITECIVSIPAEEKEERGGGMSPHMMGM